MHNNHIIITGIGNLYEWCHLGFLRRWAANECLEQIKADDLFTNCISIGPVSCNYPTFGSIHYRFISDFQGDSDAGKVAC